jgi:hypothetical protein
VNGSVLALLVIAVIGVVAWIAVRSGFYSAKTRRSRFQDRPLLEDELFYERYYSSSGLPKSVVISLRHELASAFNIDAAKLLPTDRFLEELSVVRGWEHVDDAPDEVFLLNRDLEKRLGVKIPLGDLQTADDYIRTIARYESTKGSEATVFRATPNPGAVR